MKSVRDVLSTKGHEVMNTRRDATVVDAARLMNQHRIGALVVTDGDKVVGIFTERDVLNRIVAAEKDPRATTVGDAMTTPVACCAPETSLDECRRVMREKRIRHIPVVDQGRLAGMVSIGDLNRYEISEQDETIHYLNEYFFGRH
jgi:CBS domain-containing protein